MTKMTKDEIRAAIECRPYKTVDLRGQDMSGLDLRNLDLSRADMSGSDLSDTDLRHTKLKEADLRTASMVDADLQKACLWGVNFSGAMLEGANLCRANLRKANMRDASLYGANLLYARLGGADLHGADIRYCCGNGMQIHTLQLAEYHVAICITHNTRVMAIGCQQHSIDDWMTFDDEDIWAVDERVAVDWRRTYKSVLQTVINDIDRELDA